jgi:hypothetical protein
LPFGHKLYPYIIAHLRESVRAFLELKNICKLVTTKAIAEARETYQIEAHEPEAVLLMRVVFLYPVVTEREIGCQHNEYDVEDAHECAM